MRRFRDDLTRGPGASLRLGTGELLPPGSTRFKRLASESPEYMFDAIVKPHLKPYVDRDRRMAGGIDPYYFGLNESGFIEESRAIQEYASQFTELGDTELRRLRKS